MISWFEKLERIKQITEDEKRKQREHESFVRSSVCSFNRRRVALGLRPRDEHGRTIYDK